MIKLPQLPDGREMRLAVAPPTIEYRAADGGAQQPVAFVGQAIVCGVRSNPLGGPGFRFVEIIDAKALDGADISDVEGVFNHNSDCLLGHTRSGSLTLTRTQDGGLAYRIEYDPTDPDHVRVMRKIERGDVVGSSFMFTCTADGSSWAEEQDAAGGSLYVRTVSGIAKVYDVCPVTSPAYSDATAAKRSLDSYQQDHPAPPAAHQTDEAMRARELELAGY
jgi:HK97 family phage prohead protease